MWVTATLGQYMENNKTMMNIKLHVDSVFLSLGGFVLVITGMEFHLPIWNRLLTKPSPKTVCWRISQTLPTSTFIQGKEKFSNNYGTRPNINQFQFA
jgi:hypothetical protein